MAYARIIENLVLTSTLRLDGAQWNDTLVRNVTIASADGDGIFLRNVSNVRIENVTIEGVTGAGIKLSTTGSTNGVEILDSTIARTGKDGIFSGEGAGVDHPGLRIVGNTISDTGLAGAGNGLLHGMYVQSSDFLIGNNTVLDSHGGNGISVRSSGVVRGNHIDGAYKSGISYYADHPSGETGRLAILDNIIANAGRDGARGALNLLEIPSGADTVDSIVIRNNIMAGSKGVVMDASYRLAEVATDTSDNVVVALHEALALMRRGDLKAPDPDMAEQHSGFILSAASAGRTHVHLFTNDLVSDTETVTRQKLSLVKLDQIGVEISATQGGRSASVGVEGGHIGVISQGEKIAGGAWIEAGEALVFDFRKGPGSVVDATLDMVGAGPTVLTAYRDGDEIASRTLSGDAVTFADPAGFDMLVVSSGSEHPSIGVAGLDVAWFAPDGDFLI